jgi:hypothetical protein
MEIRAMLDAIPPMDGTLLNLVGVGCPMMVLGRSPGVRWLSIGKDRRGIVDFSPKSGEGGGPRNRGREREKLCNQASVAVTDT